MRLQEFTTGSQAQHRLFFKSLASEQSLIEHAKLFSKNLPLDGVPITSKNRYTVVCSTIFAQDKNSLAESAHIASGNQVIQMLKRLDQFHQLPIKVGSQVAIINLQLQGDSVELWGFTTPKTISKIHRDPSDSSIRQFEFNNDPNDVWPRTENAEYRGKFLMYSGFFGDKKSAENALTMLTLKGSGDLDIRNHITERKVVKGNVGGPGKNVWEDQQSKITSDLRPQVIGISPGDLGKLSESAGSNYSDFDRNISRNLHLPQGRGLPSNTMGLYGVYLTTLNEGVSDKKISDAERTLFEKFSQRCANAIESAQIGDNVSLLQLSTLDIPGHRLMARLSGFLSPKEIADISTRNNIRYLKFSDGSIFPDSDNDDPVFMLQQLSMTRLFDSYTAASKAYSLYALEGQQISDQIDFSSNVDKTQPVQEVQILSRVKGKGSEPSNLPKSGRPIRAGEESRYLGRKIADYRGYEIWRDFLGGQLTYTLFDPKSRQAVITAFGSRYSGNPQSFVVSGLYAAPGNPIRAAEFYRALIQELGVTLISDRKQSPGGQRVWQQLEQFPDVEVYGYDTRTGETLNISASDEEMYAVPPGGAKGREMKKVARDIRLVATAR